MSLVRPVRFVGWGLLVLLLASPVFGQRRMERPRAPSLDQAIATGNRDQRTVYEAESIANSVSKGRVVNQDMRQFGQWSNGQQVLWVDNRPGHRLELTFRSPVAGRARVVVGMTQAADFGNVDIGFAGQRLATMTGYSAKVKRVTVSLGELELKRGDNTLIFNVTSKERLSTGYRVGVDSVEVYTRAPERPPIVNRFPADVPIGRVPLPDNSRIPNRPEIDDVVRVPGDVGRQPFPEQITLPGGADLYVEQGEFVTRNPLHLKQGYYTISFTYDVSKVKNAGAVLMQIVDGGFASDVDEGGYPNLTPRRLVSSMVLPGNLGHYRFDTRQQPDSKAITGPSYSVRIIPIFDETKKTPVGAASKAMEVYKDRAPKNNPIKLAKMLHSQRFADLVEERISQKVSGYGLAVIPFQGETIVRGGGMARTETDGAARPMTAYDRVNVASVTKFAVAIAMVKAIDANPNVDLDSPIINYLPAAWDKGEHVDTITFRELIAHRSGLRGWEGLSTNDEGLEELIKCGIADLKRKQSFSYLNHNFALMRLILPKLKFIAGKGGNGAKTIRDVNLSVLLPAGVDWASAKPDPGTALSYTFPAATTQGRNWDAKTERFGSSGLHISAMEMATLMHAFARTEKVVRADLRDEMIQSELGGRRLSDAGGTCFGKGGYLRSRKTSDPESNPSNRAEQNTMVLVFSDGSVAALVVNSSFEDAVNSPPDFSKVLIDCFNECYSEF